MSNPFRRQPASLATTDAPLPSNSGPSQAAEHAPDSTAASTTSSKVKKVRITSPPRSPPPGPYSPAETTPLQEGTVNAQHSGSPLPADDSDTTSSDDDGPDDPFVRDQSSGDESPVEPISRRPIVAVHTRTASGAPLNPFNKTLATIEGREVQSQQEQGHSNAADSQAGRPTSKPAMDVDSFKNLLMTGKATPSGAPAIIQSKVLTNLQGDSSSSTDTSSLSRQSLFETLQEPHGETPRTSYELSVSEDDDRATLIAEGSKPEKKKPPPPKHRHGKVVAPKGPQTVSFDDFSPTFGSERTSTFPITVTSPSSTKSLSRTPTDLNKPLPPPPPRTSSDEPRPTPFDLKSSTSAPLPLPSPPSQSYSDPLTSPKKVPPAPPLARRSSQMRTASAAARPRSNTAASNASQAGDESYAGSIADSTTSSQARGAAPPPPPPTRRSRAATADRPPPADLPELERRVSAARPPLVRSPSHRSQHSISGAGAPPPPPRRGSARGSVEIAMADGLGEGLERAVEGRGSSGECVPVFEEREVTPEKGARGAENGDAPAVPPPQQSHVLADMEAFRREVEELRERYSRGDG